MSSDAPITSKPSTIVGTPAATDRLLDLVRRACEEVPFYRTNLARPHFDSRPLRLTDLPILDKQIVRAKEDELVRPGFAESRSGVVLDYTSGSTGIPLRLIRTRAEVMQAARVLWRSRSEIYPDAMVAPGVQISAGELIAPESTADNTIVMSAFDLRPDRIALYIDAIDERKATWLRGHPAILGMLAEGLRRSKRRLRTQLRFIESNSGWLNPETRNLLAETFDCRVANHYGTRETYTISYECPNGTMHLLDDSVVAELHQRSDVEAAEVIVSSLIFETMPFIRYRVGDLVERNDARCTCGKTTPELRPVSGRVDELIEGTSLLGTYVFHVVVTKLARSGIRQIMHYRVCQTGMNEFEVQFVLTAPRELSAVASRFREEARTVLPSAQFRFETVDYIEPTTGGKVRVFVKCL